MMINNMTDAQKQELVTKLTNKMHEVLQEARLLGFGYMLFMHDESGVSLSGFPCMGCSMEYFLALIGTKWPDCDFPHNDHHVAVPETKH